VQQHDTFGYVTGLACKFEGAPPERRVLSVNVLSSVNHIKSGSSSTFLSVEHQCR
jgi:hypothetical protein